MDHIRATALDGLALTWEESDWDDATQASSSILPLLKDQSADVRAAACETLGRMRLGLLELREVLKSSESIVSDAAALALAQHRDRASIPDIGILADSGSWAAVRALLAWIQKDGVQDAQIWKWDLDKGIKEKVDEAPLVGQVDVSDDGSTLTWVTRERVRVGDEVKDISRLHWKQGDVEKIVAEDTEGQHTYPSLSDDGNTLVWMWKHPKINFDHEIRKIEFNQDQ